MATVARIQEQSLNTLTLTIMRRLETGWPIVMEWTPSDALPMRREDILEIDSVALRACATAREYGTTLGRAVFKEAIRAGFEGAQARDGRLRVLLVLDDPEVRSWRWERLCAPVDGRWQHLATSTRTPFAIHQPSLSDVRLAPIGRLDLRALVVVANPVGLDAYRLPPFDADRTAAGVRSSLRDISSTLLATMPGADGPPTLDEICAQFVAEPFTLLHVVCHGAQSAGPGETILYLASADGEVDPVPATRFIDRLTDSAGHRVPRLVFLSSCDSAPPWSEGSLPGLAQRLVGELGVPAVVAMAGPVSVSTATRLGEAFYVRLREHGQADLALAEACATLADRSDATIPVLHSRLRGQSIFADVGERPLTPREVEFGLARLRELMPARAPVLMPEVERYAAVPERYLATGPDRLAARAQAEWDLALGALGRVTEEVIELAFTELAAGRPPPAYDASCPFLGLYAFGFHDRDRFFGREQLVKELVGNLAHHPFLAVLGPSGSGKSSIVLAGVVPALAGVGADGRFAYFRPGPDPCAALESAVAQMPAGSLVVVDQTEEVFTLCRDEERRRAFFSRLVGLALETRVVMTMRADFLAECVAYGDLRRALQHHAVLVGPMEAEELVGAVEAQASTAGLRFEAGLLEDVVDDIRGEAGPMPLLQHALRELWLRRHGRLLSAAEYRRLGRVQEAIAESAERFFQGLPERQQAKVCELLMRLTTVGESRAAGEVRFAARRVDVRTIVPQASDSGETKVLLARLADARLVVTDGETVEVAHEALLSRWHRLRAWLAEDQEFLLWRQRVESAANEWRTQTDDGLLLRRGPLATAERWLSERGDELPPTIVEFVVASQARARQERESARRRVRFTIGGLSLALVLISAVAGLALVQRARAADERDVARSRQLAASATAQLSVDPERALLLAIRGFAIKHTPQAESVLRQATLESRVRATLDADGSPVNGAVFSPDGSSVLAGVEDGTVRIWDVTGQRAMRVLSGQDGAIDDVAVSPDGGRLATAGADGTVRVWDVGSGAERMTLTGHDGPVSSVAFSPDGRSIVSGGDDSTVRVWDLNGRSTVVLRGHGAPVWRAAFSPDGRHIVSSSEDATARVWDLAGGAPIVLTGHDGAVRAAAFSPDGDSVVTAGDDGTVRVWDVSTRGERVVLRGHRGATNDAEFSPDGSEVVSAGRDGTARVWRWTTGGEPVLLLGHSGPVSHGAFSPDGTRVVTSAADGTVRIWDPAPAGERSVLSGHASFVTDVAFGDDGRTLVSTSDDRTVRSWNIGTGEARPVPAPGGGAQSSALSPDGAFVVSGGKDGDVTLWSVSGADAPVVLGRHDGPAWKVAVSPDGRSVGSAGADGTVRVWDRQRRNEPVVLRGAVGNVYSVAFSPDGRSLASGGTDGVLRVWSRSGTAPPLELRGPQSSIYGVAFSPDGRDVATADDDGTIRVWDLSRRRTAAVLRGHSGSVWSVAFSRDGRLLASAGDDGTARVWDAKGRREPIIFGGRSAPVFAVAISPDGSVATGGGDDAVRVWNCEVCGDVDAVLALARSRVTRQLTAEERSTFLNERS